MQRARGARRGVRVVGHHDDGLAMVAVERLQEVEDLVAGLASRSPVGSSQSSSVGSVTMRARCRRAAPDRPRAARVVARAVAEADDAERRLDVLLALRPC
jgi:hypothetical protein